MKTTNKKQNGIDAKAINMIEMLKGMSKEDLAILADLASLAANVEGDETAEAPKADKPKAKTPKGIIGNWCTFTYQGVAHMGKAFKVKNASHFKVDGQEVRATECADIEKHETQGKALQRLNAIRKAEAPKAEAPKYAHELVTDHDERMARISKKNNAILATIPEGKRQGVVNKLEQVQKAGYPYARLALNKKHQLDGLHLYCGAKGHGRDVAFVACQGCKAAQWRERADKAKEEGKPRPKPLNGVFVWSPVGGGNLYARGIFGAIEA